MFELGHTYEYIDSLPMQDYFDVINYWSGKNKAEEAQQKQAMGKAKRRR